MRLLILLAALAPTLAAAQEGMRTTDRVLHADEMQTMLSGQVIEFFDGSKSRYATNGIYGYTYTDGGPVWAGRYHIAGPSEVCVDFDNGSARCDLFVEAAGRIVLITVDGLRFPVRNITVDGTDG